MPTTMRATVSPNRIPLAAESSLELSDGLTRLTRSHPATTAVIRSNAANAMLS